MTDTSGNVVESVNYDSFGNGSSSLTRYGYTGREWDTDSNLYYYRNRWYDPNVGRFVSEDPIGLDGGINLYRYVRNNPLSFTDPEGLQDPASWAIGGGEIGFAVGGPVGAAVGAGIGAVAGYIGATALWNAITSCELPPAYIQHVCPFPNTTSCTSGPPPGFGPIKNIPPLPLPPYFLKKGPDYLGQENGPAIPVPVPGTVPAHQPGPGWVWKGKSPVPGSPDGNWTNPGTGESLHPDLGHPAPIGPHTDWKDSNKKWWRIYPDGRLEPK